MDAFANSFIAYPTKFAITFPFVFHYLGACRHFVRTPPGPISLLGFLSPARPPLPLRTSPHLPGRRLRLPSERRLGLCPPRAAR